LNKNSLLNKINIKSPFEKETSEQLFDILLGEMRRILSEEKFLDIEGFGKFTVEHRKMKTVIVPKKKTEVLIPPKDKIIFTPSVEMIKRVK